MTADEINPDRITPDEARERLAEARNLAATTNRRGASVGAVTTAGVGVLVASALAASYAFSPGHRVALFVTFLVYGAALALLMTWHRRRLVVAGRGFGRAYTRSFIVTIVLYVIGIALLPQRWPWPLMTVYCVLVATPMLLASARIGGARR